RKLVFFFLQLRIKHKKVLMEFLPPTPESIEPKKACAKSVSVGISANVHILHNLFNTNKLQRLVV
ncbi:hypothetical protein, partial [Weissella cibaria]|uniref:hypothetical protein n=1 Tax=Weissella cibaria TaxID=137591 RepID=UPI00223B3EAF